MDYRISPPDEMIETTVELPLSKSICNRQLIINAMTPGAEALHEIADCDDSRILAEMVSDPDAIEPGATLSAGAAGTSFRFATAFFASRQGSSVIIDGTPRLRQRPVGQLVDALRKLGADIEYLAEEGHAPLKINGRQLAGGEIIMNASVSSQFISALMMIAPAMKNGLKIILEGEIISRPYILMTKALMQRAGAEVEFERGTITVSPGNYRPAAATVERDWSAASYWYETTALSAGFVTLPGLSTDSLQGDRAVAAYFSKLGVITDRSEDVADALELRPDPDQYSRFEEDLTENPDIAQTLAVTCAMLGIPFHLRGLSSLRIKETDRLTALQRELDKLGFIVEIRGGSEIVWNGERHPVFSMPEIDTYDDHRMAMAFAPAALYIPGLVIRDIDVVSKSYPEFWDHLRAAGFTLTDAAQPVDEPENDQ